MKLVAGVLVGLVLMGAGATPVAAQEPPNPSFDCRNARAADEKAICASVELAEMDQLVNDAYAGFEPEYGEKRQIAREIIADRKQCGGDAACIAAVYANAIITYWGQPMAGGSGSPMPAWPQVYAEAMMLRHAESVLGERSGAPMPREVGQCSSTTIRGLTDRFGTPLMEAEEGMGSVVEFENDGWQVSYARESGLVLSEVGDGVTTCLLAKPRDCPEGDERGYLYLSINENKGVYWVLTDTQHICGGA